MEGLLQPNLPGLASAAENQPENGTVAVLTRRLRCLFSVITWPIVPLGVLCFLALLLFFWAFFDDFQKTCSHPIKTYAYVTAFWCIYIPCHANLRARFFSYIRERDGPNRPPLVRRYDQLFHTLALLYVYAGITIIQTCHDDGLSTPDMDEGNATATSSDEETFHPHNTCAATCPHLFGAMAVYVLTLQFFTLSLILPLLFLPCIYLWFLRQVTADRDLAVLQERFREEEEALLTGRATVIAQEVLEELETVKLYRKRNEEIWAVSAGSGSISEGKDVKGVKECCICMNDFDVSESDQFYRPDAETGQQEVDEDDTVVRTRACGHLFHKHCIASWVGGRWQGRHGYDNDTAWRERRARRSSCPLCRTELKPSSS